ncbi:hypothetical protein BDY17DRAFT_322129 [Neohortaea acidophila]|uniref:Uncharacterized protein n=1 Tax=Neohortaea acidophila TaxID=245834 RepID=A0A6A6Q1F6_9PEZI|nr:uncharacterized protein BDY17DRAFT_322129 [Neohortaea acidophila]KAF2485267.1 hypothetical protein BDY17DRAFT_322129 [Neohortaea acidophila]
MDDLSFEAGVEEIESFYDHLDLSLDLDMQDNASSPPGAEGGEVVAALHSATPGPELSLEAPSASANHLSTPVDLIHLHQRELVADLDTNDQIAQHSAAVDPPASSPPSLAAPQPTKSPNPVPPSPVNIAPSCPSLFASGHSPSHNHGETSPDLPGAAPIAQEPEKTSPPTTQPTHAFHTPHPAPTQAEPNTTEMLEGPSSGAGSKHSLMHEMRAEELRYLPSGDVAAPSHSGRAQQTVSPTDTTIEKDESTLERHQVDRNSDSEGDDGSSSPVNLSARLRKVAEEKSDVSSTPATIDAAKHAELNAASKDQQPHKEEMTYAAIKPQGKKRKRSPSPQSPTEQQPAPQTSTQTSKTKKAKKQPKKSTTEPTDPTTTATIPDEAKQRKAPRNSLGRKELQTLLSGWPHVEPPQIDDGDGGNGFAPSQGRTRAQKLLAKEREPNAGMAAKARHRKGS